MLKMSQVQIIYCFTFVRNYLKAILNVKLFLLLNFRGNCIEIREKNHIFLIFKRIYVNYLFPVKYLYVK